MSTETDKKEKVLGLDAIPYIKGYICNACKYSEDRIKLDVNKKLEILEEKYRYIITIIESLHGSLDSFRLSNNLFGVLCGNDISEEEQNKYTEIK